MTLSFWGMFAACASDAQASEPVPVRQESFSNLWTRTEGADWPSFLGPTGDSKSPEKGISPWPAAGPPIVWQRRVGAGYGIGCVSHGRYFHFDRTSDSARVVCLHAETGEELWKFTYVTDYVDIVGYDNGPRCSPIVDGDRLYLLGVEGILHCLRADNGDSLWSVDTSKNYGVVQNFFGVGSTPVIEGRLLICMVGGSPAGSPELYGSGGNVRGNGSGIVAFDKFSGEEVYRLSDELASYAAPKLATIAGRKWCFAFARGGLLAFEPLGGKIDFHYPWRDRQLESVNASTPVVVGDKVFISETYGIGSSMLRARPGGYDIVWRDDRRQRSKAMLAHWNTPIYHQGYLYGCSGRNPPDADLRCLDWETGKVRWIEKASGAGRQRSSLLYVDEHFVSLGEYGDLKLIRANSERYELVSQVSLVEPIRQPVPPRARPRRLLRYPCWAAPILSHGLLFVRGKDRIVCLDLLPLSEQH